ncbi:RsfA family transcription factor [Cerasibacillus quisquiliarum]|uniref:DNA-binding protein n=1 Tax=Cerasibacillus quisquiliarum TaxID=227865 RepID=A0A511UY16_9BACI|nr:RsfA family transcriptional regulator [Cerasibacillus quisquiliarum]MBB5145762.1 RsfA family transcription factor [Cerasibacillus quisquiliarum]GEN30333.1 DNA-binding protein [Cerasibacillus quisquiliarum]
MYVTRQDAWTKEEDHILAETVLRFIREGKTQLEAFKLVANQLSRTSAACGFRWNATLRKKYSDAIEKAKEARKKGSHAYQVLETNDVLDKDSIETAISLLKKLKGHDHMPQTEQNYEKTVQKLEKENQALQNKLNLYKNAWTEMEKLWRWVEEKV